MFFIKNCALMDVLSCFNENHQLAWCCICFWPFSVIFGKEWYNLERFFIFFLDSVEVPSKNNVTKIFCYIFDVAVLALQFVTCSCLLSILRPSMPSVPGEGRLLYFIYGYPNIPA